MFKSPLIRTLQLLTQEELEDLHLFVASPIFNEVHRYHDKVKLFEYLKKYYPAFEHADIQRENAAAALYPGRAKPVNELERTMSLLLPIIRQYITVIYFDVRTNRIQAPSREESLHHPQRLINYIRQQLSLLRFFSERFHLPPEPGDSTAPNNQTLFLNLAEKLDQVFEQQTDFGTFSEHSFCDFYYLHFLAEYEKSHFISLQESRRAGDAHILTTAEQLDEFYLLTKLDLMSKLAIRQKTANLFPDDTHRQHRMQANLDLTKQVVQQLLTRYKFLRSPGITVYCALFDFLTSEVPGEAADHLAERFSRLLGKKAHRSAIPAERLIDFNILLRNYWVHRWNSTKNLTFLEKNHHLHREQLQLLGDHGGIHSSQFQTIILTALKLGNHGWAEKILTHFDPKRILGETNGEILFDILWSSILFVSAEKADNPASRLEKLRAALSKMPHYLHYGAVQDGYLYSIAATLDAKIRYDLDVLQEDEGASMLHATQTRIKRFKTLPEEAKERYLGFFPFAVKLYRFKEKKRLGNKTNPASIQETRAQIEADSAVVEREWLLAKCDELLPPKTENK